MGLVVPLHVGSSWTRARTCVCCIGRRILNHCATREGPLSFTSGTWLGGWCQSFLPLTSRGPGKSENGGQIPKYLNLQIKSTNCYIKWFLASSFDKWTFILIWKAKFKVRNFRFREVLHCNEMTHLLLFLPLTLWGTYTHTCGQLDPSSKLLAHLLQSANPWLLLSVLCAQLQDNLPSGGWSWERDICRFQISGPSSLCLKTVLGGKRKRVYL